jgi:aminopeptidase N
MRDADPHMIRLTDYRPPDYLVERVDMMFHLDATATRVITTSRMRPNPASNAGHQPLVLDGDELTLVRVSVDGTALVPSDYILSPETLTLKTPPQRDFTLEIETSLNPSANTKLMGLYRSNGVYCTQCEADGFRRITYFMDRPDVMATYRVRLEANRLEAPILLGNGNMVEAGGCADPDRHYAIWEDPHPKPCYLFAVVGGDLDVITDSFVTSDKRKVDLGIYVERGKADQAHYAMDALKRSMRWDEDVFGLAYDLDVFNIVAVSDFNMGAMENKGLNIFNDKYVLASPDTATDTDYALIEAIIAHEYFHNWTGNRITCRDWFQLCLKEGLTVFRDQEFSADMRSRAVKRISDVRELRARQFAEDAGPLAHPVRPAAYREINNFYTATVYEKGAEVIRMLKTIIGDDAFRRGISLYFARHDGDAATVEQFIACFAETSGRDLTHFFQWYEQAGTPRVTVSKAYDPSHNRMTLTLQQTTGATPGQPDKKPQVIPVRIGMAGATGWHISGQAAVADDLILLDTETAEVVINNVPADAVPSLLRGFSAPVTLDINLTDDDLLTLASRDDDPFNRWQSLQTLAIRILKRSTTEVSAGRPALTDPGLAMAIGDLVERGASDPAFAALSISLPGEQDLALEIGANIDPDAIHLARKTLHGAIGASTLDVTRKAFAALGDTSTSYSPDAASAGRRALRRAVLDLIIAGAPLEGHGLAEHEFATATNMTDRFAALSLLTLSGAAGRDAALATFEARYHDNALVMDKWFALQAAIPEAGAMARVESLMGHKAFSLQNPNRTRSLIGGFALANTTQFNRNDGAGYEFTGKTVVTIDKQNPQVAARIMTAFRSWRTLETGRRAKAQGVLRAIADQKNLSRDLRDIVDRTLG